MESGIRLARKSDVPALCEIWQDCFLDPEDYILYFYRENFDRISVPVFTENDQPVSMLHLMDADFVNGEKRQAAKLIYAAGTTPSRRKHGCMGALIRYAEEEALREGHALFLKPATPYLTEYYRSFGFAEDACFRLVTISPGDVRPMAASPLSAEAYNRLRGAVFSTRPFARWPDSHLVWCVKENKFCGGETLSVMLDGTTHFLMGAPRENAFLIYETDLTVLQLQQLSGALCKRFRTDFLKAYLPEDACEEGQKIISSVVFNAPHQHTYVNLILI